MAPKAVLRYALGTRCRHMVPSAERSAVPDFVLEPDLRLHYEEQGQGQPVIFLPGWTASSRHFRDQLARFGQGPRAIALDYRAHGQSTQTLVGHSLAGYARSPRLCGRA